MLKLEDVHAYYGLSHVLQGVSLRVERGEIVSLLGRNGVGKTTTFNTIMGVVSKSMGNILFEGRNVRGMPPHQIAKLGIGYIPQGKHLFPTLTVLENLILGTCAVKNVTRDYVRERLEFVFQYFPILKERSSQKAMTLSGGEQQMLAIARTLMSKPKLILLDEPSEGLAPIYVRTIFGMLDKLRKEGLTIFLAEQNVRMALKVSDRCYVMEKGRIIFEGTPKEVEEHKESKIILGL